MTNTHAHTFAAWFDHNALSTTRRTLQSIPACEKVFNRYSDEVWGVVSEAADSRGQNFYELLADWFGLEIDSLPLFKWLAVRFACEHLAHETLMLEAA
jgi:hypothetical protein